LAGLHQGGCARIELQPLIEHLLVRDGRTPFVVLIGPTGAGKTTTLYAGLRLLNDTSRTILTIEDPIEYAIDGIGQTQVNAKVGMTFAAGLRAILRQNPNVVMVGEIRDAETAQIAVQASLTGHLVLATLHANNSHHALGRILSFYTPEARPALLADLAAALKSIVCQRLLRAEAGGRVAAVEVLLNTKLVSEMIGKGDFTGVKEAMERSIADGSPPRTDPAEGLTQWQSPPWKPPTSPRTTASSRRPASS
jgi:twitching motility protein PilU